MSDDKSKNHVQIVWAAALILMGIAVFIQIPLKVQQLVDAGQTSDMIWFVRVCFYLIGCLLIGGGLRKFFQFINNKKSEDQDRPSKLGDHEGSDR